MAAKLGPFDRTRSTHNKMEIVTPSIEELAKRECTSKTLYMTGLQCTFAHRLNDGSHSDEDTYNFKCTKNTSNTYSSVVSHSNPDNGKCTYYFREA